MTPEEFIARWQGSGGSERANYTLFLAELCRVLGVPEPEPTRVMEDDNAYVFEKAVREEHADGSTSVKRIDLYRRGAFVLEAKQGVEAEVAKQQELPLFEGTFATVREQNRRKRGHGTRGTKGWDEFMLRARQQAQRYVQLLPDGEGRPPFVLVVDVGHVIEVYAEFTRTGVDYRPFPAPGPHRIALQDLVREEVRDLLRLTTPQNC